MSICNHAKNGKDYWYFFTKRGKSRSYTRAKSLEHAQQMQAEYEKQLIQSKTKILNMTPQETQDFISGIDGDVLSFFNNRIQESELIYQ
jgi:hypothetical protein